MTTDDLSEKVFHFNPLRLCKFITSEDEFNVVFGLLIIGVALTFCCVVDSVEHNLLLPRRRDDNTGTDDTADSLLEDTADAADVKDIFK